MLRVERADEARISFSSSANRDELDNEDAQSMRTQSLHSPDQSKRHDAEEGEKDPSKKPCNWAFWWPRLLILSALMIVVIVAIVFRKEVADVVSKFLTWV